MLTTSKWYAKIIGMRVSMDLIGKNIGARAGRRLVWSCFILYIVLVWCTNPAIAGYISISPEIDIKFERDQLKVLVGVTNTGDEPAFNVQIVCEVAGKVLTSGIKEKLSVRENFSQGLSSDLTLKKTGVYPIVVTVSYTDANQYPFSAMSIATLVNKETTAPKILGILRGGEFATQGSTEVVVKNLDDQPKNVQMRFVLPKELSSPDLNREISLAPHAELNIPLKVKNFSALPGSSYPVYALLEYDVGDFHFTSTAAGTVRIVEKDFVRKNKTLLIGVGVLLVIAFVYINVRSILLRRKKRGEHAGS